MTLNNLAFTFASSEVNKFGQNFIKIIELCTGKLKLKSLYDQYLKENNPSENFWHDAVDKLQLYFSVPSKNNLCSTISYNSNI